MSKKPEEVLKEVLEAIDLPKEAVDKLITGEHENMDEFNTSFQEIFISRKMARQDEDLKANNIGEFSRHVEDNLRKGFDLSAQDVKDKKYDEILTLGLEKQKTTITDLEGKIKDPAEGADEIKQLKEDLTTANTKVTEAEDKILETNRNLEEKENEFKQNLKGTQVTMMINAEKSKLTFKDDINNAEKLGFDSIIGSKYKFDIEEDKLTVTDIDGNKLWNEKKTEILTVSEVLSAEAVANKLAKLNNTPPTDKDKPTIVKVDDEPAKGKPRLHPNMDKQIENLASKSSS